MVGGATTVLVVEDEPAIRFLCTVNLEMDGFRVLEAATLDEARTVLASTEVNVVLLDVHVAGEDGRELIDEIRRRTKAIAIALISGSVDAIVARHTGADRVLTKPFDPQELTATVRELSGRRVDSLA
jgi:DNA-binding response OmpR family regulator